VSRTSSRLFAAGLLGGVAADLFIGDPHRAHPVAAFGRGAGWLQAHLEADSRGAGARFALTSVAAVAVPAAVATRLLRRRPLLRAGLTAWSTWATLGGTTLGREALGIADALERGEVGDARQRLPRLVGRDPSSLNEAGMARAVIESVAENTSDAVVAPLLWGGLLGVPGLLGYRAVNTLDAMVGHHSDRYERFGWASARLDDVANLIPARVTAVATVAAAPLVGGRPGAAWDAWRRDAGKHPSPNAGRPEAAFAGALDVRLGGPVRYPYGTSERPWLGDGRAPSAADIRRAVRLSRATSALAAGAVVIVRARHR
jgi:adenosylcobinamide-phosphate synthase